ncbi:hypothetical protein SCG7109_BU_00040 [Chlamydiales bacterium SCGC AG-110-M15]|nr:hypothetical protein SCG7109_BU_00040 [Chlamydiales bacterium SCGC AG-110-M15]
MPHSEKGGKAPLNPSSAQSINSKHQLAVSWCWHL